MKIYSVRLETNFRSTTLDDSFIFCTVTTLKFPLHILKREMLIIFLLYLFSCLILFYKELLMYILLKVVISQGFICPLCMKRCITAVDLSDHYQKVHAENETRGQELLNDASVTVGPVYFVLAVWLWVAQNSIIFPCIGVGFLLCYKGIWIALIMHA